MTAPEPLSPEIVITRVLLGLALAEKPEHDHPGDFRAIRSTHAGETSTIACLYTFHADKVIAAHVEWVERQTAAAGYPFRVTVYESGTVLAAYDHQRHDTQPSA